MQSLRLLVLGREQRGDEVRLQLIRQPPHVKGIAGRKPHHLHIQPGVVVTGRVLQPRGESKIAVFFSNPDLVDYDRGKGSLLPECLAEILDDGRVFLHVMERLNPLFYTIPAI